MVNRDLLKEAIADAKAVKETAIANAKAALEEAFTPHLKSMLAAKLEELEKDEDIEEAKHSDKEEDMMEEIEVNEEKDEIEEEFDLNEILAELEEGEDKEEMSEEVAEIEEADEEAEDAGEAEGEMEDEEIDLEDMSEDDLKSFIEDVIADMVNSGELEAGEEFEAEEGGEGMEGEEEIEDMEGMEELDEMDEVSWNEKNNPTRGANGERDPQKVGQTTSAYAINEDDLKEALKQIEDLKKEIHEVNLLNAKLLYTNKIFKSKNLNESQKIKVLKAFDKVATVKEAKLIFETLNEGLTTTSKPSKSMVSEIKGSASKATGMIKENIQPIVEVDPMVARWQKLAGIK